MKKSGYGLGLGEFPNISRFPYDIYATAEASKFKIGKRLEFAKAHHKIPQRRKSGRGTGREEFPFNISATAALSS